MDTIGRIGFLADSTVYKLCTIKVSNNDGSLYIGFNHGDDHVNRGITGQKITYHPDGNTWLTADLQEKVVGREFIDSTSKTHIPGMTFGARGHVYVKGESYEMQASFDEIEREKLVVRLKNGAEFFDIHKNNDYSSIFAAEIDPAKLQMSNILPGKYYFGMKVRFFLAVESRRVEFEDAVKQKGNLRSFSYAHPLRNITIFVTIENSTN